MGAVEIDICVDEQHWGTPVRARREGTLCVRPGRTYRCGDKRDDLVRMFRTPVASGMTDLGLIPRTNSTELSPHKACPKTSGHTGEQESRGHFLKKEKNILIIGK